MNAPQLFDPSAPPITWGRPTPPAAPTFAAAAARRTQAVATVAANTDPGWSALAWAGLVRWLETHQEFFVDDFWADSGVRIPAEPRAIGPLLARASRERLMERTGRSRPSTRSNLAEKPVWRSLIFKPACLAVQQDPGPPAAGRPPDPDPSPELLTQVARIAKLGADAGWWCSSGSELMAVIRWQAAMNGHPDPTAGASPDLGDRCWAHLERTHPTVAARLHQAATDTAA